MPRVKQSGLRLIAGPERYVTGSHELEGGYSGNGWLTGDRLFNRQVPRPERITADCPYPKITHRLQPSIAIKRKRNDCMESSDNNPGTLRFLIPSERVRLSIMLVFSVGLFMAMTAWEAESSKDSRSSKEVPLLAPAPEVAPSQATVREKNRDESRSEGCLRELLADEFDETTLIVIRWRDDSYDDIIEDRARRYGVDPALVMAIVMAESSYDALAESHRGARGLMQLMPRTATALGVEDAFDPEENIDAGVRYFRRLMESFDGRTDLALAAYNAGSRRVREHQGVPPFPETQHYIKKVSQYYRYFQSLYGTELDRV